MLSSFPTSPVPWQVAETILDSASEPNSLPDTPALSDYGETLSGRWGKLFLYI